MKTITLNLLLIVISLQSSGQDSLWERKIVNEILSLDIAAKSQYVKSAYITAYGGKVSSNVYGLQYYDTVFLPVETDSAFLVSLIGFMNGRLSDSSLKKYDVLIFDTSIGGTKGLIALFTTRDEFKNYKRKYYYVTMANNRFYWFYAYTPVSTNNDENINHFFKSITFNSEILKERSFNLTPVYWKKNAD